MWAVNLNKRTVGAALNMEQSTQPSTTNGSKQSALFYFAASDLSFEHNGRRSSSGARVLAVQRCSPALFDAHGHLLLLTKAKTFWFILVSVPNEEHPRGRSQQPCPCHGTQTEGQT